MLKSKRTIGVTLLAFAGYFFLDEAYFRILRQTLYDLIPQLGISHILTYLIVGIPIFMAVIGLSRTSSFFERLGLNRSFIHGLLFALLCTLPMFVGYAMVFDYNASFTLDLFLITVLSAGFFEELYFRGFLFGQIYRYTRWGFIPSVFIGAVLFGLVHLYQGTGLAEITGIFLVTFLGAILFAWVFVEWNYNLWAPIFLHLLMNLSWDLFSVGTGALGDQYANLFRMMTIALVILGTIGYKKKRHQNMAVDRKTVWMKNGVPVSGS